MIRLTPAMAFVLALAAGPALARDCRLADGLLPDPFEGWELFNDVAPEREGARAEATYSLILETDREGVVLNPETAESVSIRIESDPAVVAPMVDLFQRGPMPGMLEAGPLGYPVMVGQSMTVAGDFQIIVDGNGPGTDLYFNDILSCAAAAGLEPAAIYGD
jgi:hypothetical protein